MDVDALQSVLEHMFNLRLDSPQHSDGVAAAHPDGVTEKQLAAAVVLPAQPAAAAPAENDRRHADHQSAAEWAAVIVNQMTIATSVEDAQCRAAKILEAFGGSVCSRAAQMLAHKDRVLGTAVEHNSVLKKVVVAQQRRHLAGEAKVKELQGQLLQYQEQVRRLEADKYALSMHLRNAGPAGSSMPGNFPPEVC